MAFEIPLRDDWTMSFTVRATDLTGHTAYGYLYADRSSTTPLKTLAVVLTAPAAGQGEATLTSALNDLALGDYWIRIWTISASNRRRTWISKVVKVK